jgi:hypothetical protein
VGLLLLLLLEQLRPRRLQPPAPLQEYTTTHCLASMRCPRTCRLGNICRQNSTHPEHLGQRDLRFSHIQHTRTHTQIHTHTRDYMHANTCQRGKVGPVRLDSEMIPRITWRWWEAGVGSTPRCKVGATPGCSTPPCAPSPDAAHQSPGLAVPTASKLKGVVRLESSARDKKSLCQRSLCPVHRLPNHSD